MSGHFLLAPIPESSSDYLLPKDIKLAVLGAGRVGKSGECGGAAAQHWWWQERSSDLREKGPTLGGTQTTQTCLVCLSAFPASHPGFHGARHLLQELRDLQTYRH